MQGKIVSLLGGHRPCLTSQGGVIEKTGKKKMRNQGKKGRIRGHESQKVKPEKGKKSINTKESYSAGIAGEKEEKR